MCQLFSPVSTNETLQEYIQRFIDLAIQATGTGPTAVTCQVTILLFIRQLFHKEIQKRVAEVKTFQTFQTFQIKKGYI